MKRTTSRETDIISSQKFHKLSFLLSNLSLKNRIIVQHISATRDKVLWYFIFVDADVESTLHTILNVVNMVEHKAKPDKVPWYCMFMGGCEGSTLSTILDVVSIGRTPAYWMWVDPL